MIDQAKRAISSLFDNRNVKNTRTTGRGADVAKDETVVQHTLAMHTGTERAGNGILKIRLPKGHDGPLHCLPEGLLALRDRRRDVRGLYDCPRFLWGQEGYHDNRRGKET